MKTDKYMQACLEQAHLSPLRYRHGCIIVRGGKIIGQGFNDHRAGFSGDALKSGRLPARSLNGAALADLKKNHKLKQNSTDMEGEVMGPFETVGGGALANTPLSMHSEMMAIHSALSASSTMASSTVSSQKRHFRLSGDSKRKARLRRDAIKTYVETICKAALAQSAAEQHASQWSVQQRQFKGSSPQPRQSESRIGGQGGQRGCGSDSRGKYQETPNEKQEFKSTRQWQPIQGSTTQRQASTVCAAGSNGSSKFFGSETSNSYKKKRNSPTAPTKIDTMVVPKDSVDRRSHSIADRTKTSRIKGADLYVARLGWKDVNSNSNDSDACCDGLEVPESAPANPCTGSLHDELLSSRRPTKPLPIPANSTDRVPSVLASRPCYRCISYMDSVGIKRVFWTTDAGEWEGAKVRDLLDALDNLGQMETADVAGALKSVFVTKHEVLMLRRRMGGDG